MKKVTAKVTAKDSMEEQHRRFIRMKRKEQENNTSEEAKTSFRRKPYMGMYRKRDQCGNERDGRSI